MRSGFACADWTIIWQCVCVITILFVDRTSPFIIKWVFTASKFKKFHICSKECNCLMHILSHDVPRYARWENTGIYSMLACPYRIWCQRWRAWTIRLITRRVTLNSWKCPTAGTSNEIKMHLRHRVLHSPAEFSFILRKWWSPAAWQRPSTNLNEQRLMQC